MNKKILLFILLMFSFFLLNKNAYAECSYNTRKTLLEEAKKTEINYEVETKKETVNGTDSFSEEERTFEYTTYKIKFNISNLNDNLYIRYFNDLDGVENYITPKDLKDGVYSFYNEDVEHIYTYQFDINTYESECIGKNILSKKIIKPKYNSFSSSSVCKEKKYKDSEYCKEFITKVYTENEINSFEDKAIQTTTKVTIKENEKTNIFKVFKEYWYYFVIGIVIIIICLLLIFLSKRRNRLL